MIESARSRQAAPCSAVSPYLFTALTSAPSSRHNFTAANPLLSVERVIPGSCPTPAASISGVVPSVVVKDGSAPCAAGGAQPDGMATPKHASMSLLRDN